MGDRKNHSPEALAVTATPLADDKMPRDSLMAAAAAMPDPTAMPDPAARPDPAASRSRGAARIGARLDHYRIIGEMGEGGMGTVFEAIDESLERPVALKVLRDILVTRPGQRERFLREARAQASLNHPNVVHIYYIGRWAGDTPASADSLFFAMERVDGQSLECHIDAGECIGAERACDYMIQVARGLRAAQKGGIIHRDIKPSNLLCNGEGHVKVADFGLAKPIDDDLQITRDGVMVGSPLYMAPEQARGLQVDHRADMYSMGATFYHLLSGQPVFTGESPLAVIAQHLATKAPPLRHVAPQVPPALAAIVDRLLKKDPGARYRDYDQLIEVLEAAAPSRIAYAGFWARGAAVALDAGLASALIALVGWPGLLVHLIHVTVGQAYRGQTLAKYFLRMQVRRKDGRRLGLGRALLRTLLALWMPILLGIMILLARGAPVLEGTIEQLRPDQLGELQNLLYAIGISNGFLTLLFAAGLALAGFHPQKRAIHDLLAGSVVTYRMPNA